MTPSAKQLGRNGHVADTLVRIDIGRFASPRPVDHRQADITDRQFFIDPVQFGPRFDVSVKVDVGTEPQWIDRAADGALEFANAGQIDDVDALDRNVGEAVRGGLNDPLARRAG